MRNLLEEFWYGNISPHEEYTKRSFEERTALRLMDKNRTKLSEVLTDSQNELLKKYDDSVIELNCILELELFIYAFRLGGKFMLESLSEES